MRTRLILIAAIAIGAFASAAYIAYHARPRVGVDWEHRRFMLPPGELPPRFQKPQGADEIWYEQPEQGREI